MNNGTNYAWILRVNRKVDYNTWTNWIGVEKGCCVIKSQWRALLFWKPQTETMSVVPHGLPAQVQQLCQCFTETPRGHKRDRSRTPDSSHRVLWHLEGKVTRSRVGFFSSFSGCRQLPATTGDGRSRVGATCRNLGCCGRRVWSESSGHRDENRRFDFPAYLVAPEEARPCYLFSLVHRRFTLWFWVVWLLFAWNVCR